MTPHETEIAQHALRIKNVLDLFYGRMLPEWATDAIVSYSTELHRAVFPPPARALRGPAKILQFRRPAKRRGRRAPV